MEDTQSEIRIADPALCRRIDRIQAARGDKTRTRTARDLLIERLAQIEDRQPAPDVTPAEST